MCSGKKPTLQKKNISEGGCSKTATKSSYHISSRRNHEYCNFSQWNEEQIFQMREEASLAVKWDLFWVKEVFRLCWKNMLRGKWYEIRSQSQMASSSEERNEIFAPLAPMSNRKVVMERGIKVIFVIKWAAAFIIWGSIDELNNKQTKNLLNPFITDFKFKKVSFKT